MSPEQEREFVGLSMRCLGAITEKEISEVANDLRTFISKLLEEKDKAVEEVIKRWEGDGQFVTKCIIHDLRAIIRGKTH